MHFSYVTSRRKHVQCILQKSCIGQKSDAFYATLAFVIAGAIVLAILADRDRHAANAARRAILDQVASLFDNATLTLDPSGFPKLTGSVRGDAIHVAF